MRAREELAWAAGLFDGEGHISAQKYMGTLSVTQVVDNVELLERFRSALGLGVIYGPYRHPRRPDTHKDTMKFHITGFEKIQAAVAMLWPWLGRAKREQYRRAFGKTFVFHRRRGGNHRVQRAIQDARERGNELFVIWNPRQLLMRNAGGYGTAYGRTSPMVPAPHLRVR